jgi:uncharacterized protein (DUF58 family)
MKPPLLESPASIFLVFLTQAFMLLFLFVALLYNEMGLIVFSLVILSLGVGAYLWARVSAKRVDVRIGLNRQRLFPGESLKVDFRIRNPKWLPVLFTVHLFIPESVAGAETGQWIEEKRGLLWFQETGFHRVFSPNRRGVYNLGPPRVQTGDLFGFIFRNHRRQDRLELIVYPRLADIRVFSFPRKEFFGVPGTRCLVEDPVFVFGTRDYQFGSPARRIHWKASARHNRLQEKLCEPAEQEKVLMILDVAGFEAEGAEEAFEETLEVMAALVLQLEQKGIAVGLVTNGRIISSGGRGCSGIVPISRSSHQSMAILETLARVESGCTFSIVDILADAYPPPRGVSCICFAWCRTAISPTIGSFMNRRNIPVLYVAARISPDADMGTTDTAVHEPAGRTVGLDQLRIPGGRKT